MLQETQFLTAFQDMRYASVRESQEKKKKKLSLSVRSGNIMKIYKYSNILFVLDQKNVHLLGRQIGIPPSKNKQLSFLQPAKYTKIMKWFGRLLLFLSCEAPSPGLGSTSNAVNIAILVDRESVVNLCKCFLVCFPIFIHDNCGGFKLWFIQWEAKEKQP